MEVLTWLGAVSIDVVGTISTLNWISEAQVNVCHSDPGLIVKGYCGQCSGSTTVRYKKQ